MRPPIVYHHTSIDRDCTRSPTREPHRRSRSRSPHPPHGATVRRRRPHCVQPARAVLCCSHSASGTDARYDTPVPGALPCRSLLQCSSALLSARATLPLSAAATEQPPPSHLGPVTARGRTRFLSIVEVTRRRATRDPNIAHPGAAREKELLTWVYRRCCPRTCSKRPCRLCPILPGPYHLAGQPMRTLCL